MKDSFVLRAAACAAVLASGCVGALGTSDVARVEGSLGAVSFRGVPEVREVRLTPRELYVDLRIEGASGAAMVGITVPRAELDGRTVWQTERVAILGCAGPEDGEWAFDCAPQEFFVDAFEGKEQLRLDFEARWRRDGCGDVPRDAPDDGQPVDGYVLVDLR
ncbi:MAG: hypothetical protein KF729_06890 [Sandaracinaceae bacterium]|nr:hypothetical protein [Sandaracinaceae bacterium]